MTEGPSPSAHRAAEPRPNRYFFTAPLSRVGARGAEVPREWQAVRLSEFREQDAEKLECRSLPVAVQKSQALTPKQFTPESVANALPRPGQSDSSMSRRSLLPAFQFAAPTRVDSRSCYAREYHWPTRSSPARTAPWRPAQRVRSPWLQLRAGSRPSKSVAFPSKTPSPAAPRAFRWSTAPRLPSSLSPAVTFGQQNRAGRWEGSACN